MGVFPAIFDQLGAKLTKASNSMMVGLTTDLNRRLFNLKEKCIKDHGTKVKGRQLLWTIYQFFKVDPNPDALFGVEDLMAVVMHGNKLDEFLAKWDR
eukprot:13680391-Heterocapsa_arctica.AAC.1